MTGLVAIAVTLGIICIVAFGVAQWIAERNWRAHQLALREQIEQMWSAQLYRQAQEWRYRIERDYRESPVYAKQNYGVETVEEALADPEGLYQHCLQESQREWDWESGEGE